LPEDFCIPLELYDSMNNKNNQSFIRGNHEKWQFGCDLVGVRGLEYCTLGFQLAGIILKMQA
jgi:hypothetical protein